MSPATRKNGAHLPSMDKMGEREGLREQDQVARQKESPVPDLPACPHDPILCDPGREDLSAIISMQKGNTSLFSLSMSISSVKVSFSTKALCPYWGLF